MKKLSLFAAAALALAATSCSSVSNTATVQNVNSKIVSTTSADLTVGPRATFTLTPTKAQQKAGERSVKAAAVSALLSANGNADVLVAPEFEIKRKGMGKIKYVKVSGRPASYKDFHQTTQAEAEIYGTTR